MAIEGNLTLGQYLRHERERRGLTIEQVASATKIGIRTLHALESDHYAELPAKPFIRGFVISYSRFVGLDHKETLTHFNAFLDERVQQERPNRESGHSGYAFEKRDSDPGRMILGVTMGGFVLIGAVTMVLLKPSLKHHHGSHLDKLRAMHEAVSPEPLALASVAPRSDELASASLSEGTHSSAASHLPESRATAISLASAPSPNPSPSPIAAVPDPLNSGFGLKPSETSQRVVCKALESVWVRYRVDAKPVMQYILKKDKVVVLRGRQSVILQVGEPEHLKFSANGGSYRAAASDKGLAMRQNDATFFFPAQLAKTIEEPFPGEKALSSRKSPVSSVAAESTQTHQ